MPSRARASALLPDPTGPVTATRLPGAISRENSASAGRVAPGYVKVTFLSEAPSGPDRPRSVVHSVVGRAVVSPGPTPATWPGLNDANGGSPAKVSAGANMGASRA